METGRAGDVRGARATTPAVRPSLQSGMAGRRHRPRCHARRCPAHRRPVPHRRAHAESIGGTSGDIEPGYYAAFDAIAARRAQPPARRRGRGRRSWGRSSSRIVPDMQPDGREVAIIENVIVDAAARSGGVGSAMMRWAVDEARRHGCSQVKLTQQQQARRRAPLLRAAGLRADARRLQDPAADATR